MESEDQREATAFTLELLERLRPYLGESLLVLDRDWTIKANLAPPDGLIGRGLGIGLHTLEHMHPDDAVAVLELGAQAFDTELGWQGSKIVRMNTGDGTYRRYELTATNLFDDPVVGGLVVRTREVVADAQDDLAGIDTSSTLQSIAELLPIGLLVLDDRARVVVANQSACALFDRSPEQLKRSGSDALFDPVDRPEITEALERLTRERGRHECVVALATEPTRVARCCFSAEGTEHVTRIVVTIEDVTERHAAQLDLAHRASHDALTGLKNRWSILDEIRRRLADGEPITVAYVDLDGFKEINDTWGHDRGDEVLMTLAGALRAGLDDSTEIARIGGDEFVVVWGGTVEPETIVAQIHELIAVISRTEGLEISASIGTASATPGDTHRDLLRRADLSMYAEKSGHVARPDDIEN